MRTFICVISALIFNNVIQAQNSGQYDFGDGFRVKFNVLENDMNEAAMTAVSFFPRVDDIFQIFSAYSFHRGKFFINTDFGPLTSYGADFSWFFRSKKRPTKKGIPVRTVGTKYFKTHYRMEVDFINRTYNGLHFGYKYKDFNDHIESGGIDVIVHEIALGYVWLRGRHAKVFYEYNYNGWRGKIKQKNMMVKATSFYGVYTDLLLFPFTHDNRRDMFRGGEVVPREKTNLLGARVFIRGRLGAWSVLGTGFTYKIGAQYNGVGEFNILFGIGVDWGVDY